jgi:subtilisin family serine protease
MRDEISPWVLDATADGDQTDFLIVLTEQTDLSPAYTLLTKQARGRFVRDVLWERARRSQVTLRAWLDARQVPYRSFYIVNLIHVQTGDRALVEALAARSDVARIEANPRIRNVQPQWVFGPQPLSPSAIEWNIVRVGAPDVWAMGYTGQDIVIGGQDTGYDWDHPALVNQYRGWDGATADHDYNWHDAVHSGGGTCGPDSSEPCDDQGHGTLTMGIAVGGDGGSHQIGVAPGARWIGCRNMNRGIGSPATYLECFEFFLAPYPLGSTPGDGNPDMAPDVTNNSWACPPSEGCSWDILQAAVEAQRAAGIMTVVAAGNAGSSCSTISSPPAIYDASYSVGATNSSDDVAGFSSRGPVTKDSSGRLKPDISAPGVGVRSSTVGGGYGGGLQGTSFASPHVAGAVALIWSAQPALRGQIDRTEEIINTTAVPRYSAQCDSQPGTVPNNVYGWGRLDTLEAVNLALTMPSRSFYLPAILRNYAP